MEKQAADDSVMPAGEPTSGNPIQLLMVLAFVVGLGFFASSKGYNVASIATTFFGLSFIIFIHEFGHFAAAKWCDVHVEAFSIGLGPAVPGCKFRRGETTYLLGIFPLGGYVKMVGEGSDAEEAEDDPRSFKNKTVPQRMLIISAGVIMNLIFAACAWVGVFMVSGLERISTTAGNIDPGSPSWQIGVPTGAAVDSLGGTDIRYFEKFKEAIVLSAKDKKLPIRYRGPDGKTIVDSEILPRYDAISGMPLIGIGPAQSLRLTDFSKEKVPSTIPGSSADRASPAFQPGDLVIAATDPSSPSGDPTDLPPDPRDTSAGARDFFELHRRSVELADKPMTFRVRRGGGKGEAPTELNITVPPQYTRDLGFAMRMGEVTAVRDGSPAAKSGIQPKASAAGDVIKAVRVAKPGGGSIRFLASLDAKPPADEEQRLLDPVRLPHDLAAWAKSAAEPKIVRIVVNRVSSHKIEEVELDLPWDDAWKYSREQPYSRAAVQPIPQLGLAYRVRTEVQAVRPGGAAAKAGLHNDDVVKEFQLYRGTTEDPEALKAWDALEPDQWASAFVTINERSNAGMVNLKVEREGKSVELTLKPDEDKTWPMPSRGIEFETERRLQKASDPWQALKMGAQEELSTVLNTYLTMKRLFDGRISLKHISGPVTIARVSYFAAEKGMPDFFNFLAIISVNLAVFNFLPFPVLDGGHMVFLIYERLRGKVAPESVSQTATVVGVAVLLSLMLAFLVWDVIKLW